MISYKTLFERSCESSTLSIHILFISIVIVTIGLAFFFVRIHSFFPQSTDLSVDILIEIVRGAVNPERTERFVFISLVTVVPIIAFFAVFASASPGVTANLNRIILRRGVAMLLPLIVAALLFAPFFRSNFISTILGKYSDVQHPDYPTIILLGAISLLWCFKKTSEAIPKPSLSREITNTIVWLIFISSVLLQLLSWRLLGINSVSGGPEWFLHADAVIYSLSQVLAGKTLLVDLPSQYGLWAEMLAPLFSITGFSVLGLTSLFAAFQLLSLASLFFVLSKLVKIPSLRAIVGISLVMVTFGTYVYKEMLSLSKADS